MTGKKTDTNDVINVDPATEVAWSWNLVRENLIPFVQRWKDETSEAAEYATFWDELLRCYGVDRKAVANYQYAAKRASTGNTGAIDVFWPKVFIGEHKSFGKGGMNLEGAEDQARDYLLGGDIKPAEYPRYVVSCDFHTLRIVDLEGDGDDARLLPLEDLVQEPELLGFLTGRDMDSIAKQDQVAASYKAAKVMADLYAALTDDADTAWDLDGEDYEAVQHDANVHKVAVLLTRLLFCMFSDDAGLWQRDLFTNFVKNRTRPDGTDVGPMLRLLFDIMDTPEGARSKRLDDDLAKFPYVNGGIFARDVDAGADLVWDARMRQALIVACDFDWRGISPAVFGSLFQAVKSKAARRLEGEHYTTETNILKVIEPLFLDDYRSRVRHAWSNPVKLAEIRAELATNKYLDPACGCGNFLVVAYRELRRIELSIVNRIAALTPGGQSALPDPALGLVVRLDQFYGIEINWWPKMIAETAMFLVDHQANIEYQESTGQPINRLPLKISATIKHDNALTCDWADLVPSGGNLFIFGNPPFVGQYTKDPSQVADMRLVWGSQYNGYLDYVTAWFKKSLDLFSTPGYEGEFAFVSTNSICQGQPVPALFGPIFNSGWRIKFAHRTFVWSSEAPGAAAVHCIVTGYHKSTRRTANEALYVYSDPKGDPQRISVTEQINAYLVDGPNVLVVSRETPLSPVLSAVNKGSQPTDNGYLLVDSAEHAAVIGDPIAAKYVRPFIGARELVHSEPRWCLWLEDLDPSDLGRSRLLKDRVESCRSWREAQVKTGDAYKLRLTPHLFRPNTARPLVPYLAIPRHVSESRLYFPAVRFGPDVICGDANFTTEDPDGVAFAVISSSMFITWQRAVGGHIKSDLRFNKVVTWNTFPLPMLSDNMRGKLIEAGEGVLAARDLHPDWSLAEHYNPLAMTPELLKAHRALDKVMDRAMGAKAALADNDARLELLFDRYAMAVTEGQMKLKGPKYGK